jgi:hypothetical protein
MPFMKRTNGKPSDARLKYFTRELYLKSNSREDVVANEAEEEWERAIHGYQKRLRQIKSKLPPEARMLTKMSLHDAELVGKPLESASGQWGLIAVCGGMGIGKSTIHLLRYELVDRMERISQDAAWPFSNKQVSWLYDEVDLSAQHKGRFVHRILFSDGGVVVVLFKNVKIDKWPFELLQRLNHLDVTTSDTNKDERHEGRELRAITID